MNDTIQIDLDYKDNILCFLQKSERPLISKVQVDEYTELASKNFDYDFNGVNEFYGYDFPKELVDLDFQILCIVGQSGSGKSVFSRYFGKEEELVWDNSKAIISQFTSDTDAVNKLSCVGLNSIPTWVKPRNVLSIGEGFRVDLARRLKSNCVIDEFTSTIDRETSKSCCVSISKYIRKNNLQRCVFVSCHKDFIDYLCPDYVVDMDDACVYDTRRLPRHKTVLQVYEEKNKQSIWRIFGKYHYLSHDLNYACRIISLRYNDEPIGMCAVLPFPSGNFRNAYRIHRLVILPEYQGMGIGTKLLSLVSNMIAQNNRLLYIKTSHARLRNYLSHSADWQESTSSGKRSLPLMEHDYSKLQDRIAYSFKYVGNARKNDVKTLHMTEATEKNTEQMSLL